VQIVRQAPLTPGGMGLIEASLLAGLVAAGAGRSDAAAVVIIYRVLSCWLILPIGALSWSVLHQRSHATAAGYPSTVPTSGGDPAVRRGGRRMALLRSSPAVPGGGSGIQTTGS
jgi:hypothetical protein